MPKNFLRYGFSLEPTPIISVYRTASDDTKSSAQNNNTENEKLQSIDYFKVAGN